MDNKRLVHFIIMFAITIGISLLPPIGQITAQGMKVIGVFVGVLYGWIFIDLIWPSVFGFVCLSFTGLYTVQSAFASGIGNSSLIMILITMVFAGALEEAGLTNFMADWFLKRKIFRKNPWVLLCGIIAIGFVLGFFKASMAAIFLLWGLVLKIAESCGIDKKDPLISFCIMMIVLACMTGGGSLPFSGGALIYGGYLTQATGVTIPYMPFIIFAVTIYGLALVAMFIVFKVVFKLKVDKFMISDEIAAELEKKESTKQQRVTFAILIIYIAALLLPGIIPNAPGMALLNKLGVVGVSAIGLLVLNFIVIDEKPLIDIGKTFAKHVQWPLMLLLAVTFPLADAIKHADSGIMVTITQAVTPLISDMGITTFMIVSMIALGIITQFTHNVVLGAMFIPFLCPLCQEMGGNMITFWFMIYIVLNAAYVTPAGSMNSAMVHGHECMNKKDAYIMGAVYLLIIFALLIAVGLPLGNLLF